jgi:hypothetical protein
LRLSQLVLVQFSDRGGAGAVFPFGSRERAGDAAVVLASGLLSVVFSAQRRARALGISYQVGRISLALLSLLRLRLGFPNLSLRCGTTFSFIFW